MASSKKQEEFQPESFEEHKAHKLKFFGAFIKPHIHEWQLYKEYGLLTKEWINVSEHCLIEGAVCDVLGELLGLDKKEINTIVAAAFLHDFYKRKELEEAAQYGSEAFSRAVKESTEILRNHGFSEKVIKLIEAVGHNALKRIMEKDVSLSEKIIHYADDIVLGANIVLLDERIDYLELNPNYKELNQSGRKIFNGKTYFEVQREVGHKIEQEFAKKLSRFAGSSSGGKLKDPKKLPEFIKQEIHKKIEKVK